jgi:signal transduction histidine kinase
MLDITRLTRLLSILSEPAPIERMLDRVVSTMSELFAADIVLLLDPGRTGSLVPVAMIGLPEDVARRFPSPERTERLTAALHAASPIVSAGPASAGVEDPLLEALGVESVAWLPVRDSRDVRGLFMLARCGGPPFAAVDVDLLLTMAYRVGLTLEQAERRMQLEKVVTVGAELGRSLDEASVARAAVREFPLVAGASAAAMVLALESGGFECVSATGMDERWVPVWTRLAGQLARRLGDSPTPFSTADLGTEPECAAHGLSDECPARAVLAVPLQRQDRTRGFLFAIRHIAVAFGAETVNVARLVAGQVSAALENARLYRSVRDELNERLRAEAERERLEADLRAAQKMEAIATFAGGIAHDFNNLLLLVIGNLELARAESVPGLSGPAFTADALEASLQAVALTKKFQLFAENREPRTSRIDTKQVISDAVSLALSGSNVSVEFALADDLWDLDADGSQIGLALGAVVMNAREAMPAGGTVTVRAQNVDERRAGGHASKRQVRIAVEDQGRGIAAGDLARIFDPYYSTKQRGSVKGMGLGLSVTRSIVVRHGGHISVESVPGSGTSFVIWLPAAAVAAAPEVTETRTVTALEGHGGPRILLLEDEDSVAQMTMQMLARLGYDDVEHARTGEEAMALASRANERGTPLTVAILDLTIKGGMGGRQTLPRLLEIVPALQAIVSSGYSVDPVLARYREFGFRAALPKPYRLEDLGRALKSVVGR